MIQEYAHDFLPGLLQFLKNVFQVLIPPHGRTCRDIIRNFDCRILRFQIVIAIWISRIDGILDGVRDKFSYLLYERLSLAFLNWEIFVGN